MTPRIKTTVLLGPIALVMIAWGTWHGLRNSDAFAGWALQSLIEASDETVSIQSIKGNLADGLRLRGVQVSLEQADIEVGQVEAVLTVGWLPLRVSVESALVSDVAVHMKSVDDTTRSEDGPVSLEGLVLPIPLKIRDTSIIGIEVTDSDGAEIVALDRVSLAGDWHESIDSLQLTWLGENLEGQLNGSVSLKAPNVHEIQASVTHPMLNGDADISLSGDASETQLQVSAKGLGANLEGLLSQPLNHATADISFELSEYIFPADEPEPPRLAQLTGTFAGDFDGWTLAAEGVLDGFGLDEHRIALDGYGEGQDLEVRALTIRGDHVDATVSGVLAWPLSEHIEFDLELTQLDPANWVPDWPDGKTLYGKARLLISEERLAAEGLALNMAGTEFQLTGSAELITGSEQLSANLDWSELDWPPAPAGKWLTSSDGNVQLEGKLDDWTGSARFHLDLTDYPGGRFTAEAHGGRTFGTFNILEGQALDGQFSGTAGADWSGAFNYQADLVVAGAHLGHLSEDWPVTLSADLSVSHDLGTERVSLGFDRLLGTYQGAEFTGNGAITFGDGLLHFDEFHLQEGSSRLYANGAIDSGDGLVFEVKAERPDKLADLIGGDLSGNGRLKLGAGIQVIDVQLHGEQLAWDDLRISELDITSEQNGEFGVFSLQGAATGVQWGEQHLDGLDINLSGNQNQQTLSLALLRDDLALNAAALGAVVDWNDLLDSGWRGQLNTLVLSDTDLSFIRLAEPANLAVSKDGWSLQDACLVVVEEGGLCIGTERKANGRLSMQSKVHRLPLDASRHLWEHQVEFTQWIEGDFEFAFGADVPPSGFANLIISEGLFGDESDDVNPIETGEGVIRFEIRDGDLVSGQFDIPLPGVGEIDSSFAVQGLALDGTGELSGHLSTRLNTLSALDIFASGLAAVDGQFEADFDLGGRTGDPNISGAFDLTEGQAQYSLFGTQLSDISLHGEVGANDFFHVDGSFRAGEGNGEIGLTLDFEDLESPVLTVLLTGEELKLLDATGLEAWFDLDLRADLETPNWLLEGSVDIPRASLSPEITTLTRVSESEDVEIVAGDIPETQRLRASTRTNLRGEVAFSLGDSVKLDTEIAELTLGGAVNFTWQENLVPIGNGEIVLDGDIRAFGPVLRVERGRVRFQNVPANNPVLDIRAERDIFGNTAIRAAGVAVTGAARRPEIEAYTQPLTTRERAWGLLITGSDFDVGQGVGAFDVGTYIAPRLFVSYGVSLFDDDNVVSARFDLKRGFGVKASSGQRETGIDISYTVDR